MWRPFHSARLAGCSTVAGKKILIQGFFVTGTDTSCGKTAVTLGLMHLLQSRGYSVLGMKPVASGAELTPQGLRNDDALRIQQQASQAIDYNLINPFVFAPPIAPHLAAKQAGVKIELKEIVINFKKFVTQADYIIVEGVGGWLVPLGPDQTVSDLASRLGLPVILVVGFRLGCLNHALLTIESILRTSVPLAGWVATTLDPDMLEPEANLESLKTRIQAPFLGFVPYLEKPTAEAVGGEVNIGVLY